jgi:cell wall-associated NlpC family hydrolase
MPRRPRLQQLLAATTVCVSLAGPSVVMAAHSGDVQDRSAQLASKVPGAYLQMRDHVGTDAARALQIIARTDNYRDEKYLAARRVVSDRIATQMSLDAQALDAAWSATTRSHQIAILAALTQLDVPYLVGAENPYRNMDCSGLLWYAWRAGGVDMPRESASQLHPKLLISRSKARAGDILGEGTHVHIYLGVERAVVHAPNTGGDVTLKMMSVPQWNRVLWADPTRIAIFRVS